MILDIVKEVLDREEEGLVLDQLVVRDQFEFPDQQAFDLFDQRNADRHLHRAALFGTVLCDVAVCDEIDAQLGLVGGGAEGP